MRQDTFTRTIAKFDELNEDQKRKVLSNLDLSQDFEFQSKYTLEYFQDALNILGFSDIKIRYSGFWSQGDGASFTARFSVPKNSEEILSRVKELKRIYPNFEVYNIEEILFSDYEIEDEVITIHSSSSRYCHEGTVSCNNEELQSFVRHVSHDIYKALENDYEHINSDEYKIDTIEANEWEFYTDTLEMA